jgi:hypothetical protein
VGVEKSCSPGTSTSIEENSIQPNVRTSMRQIKAFRSSKRNELPADIAWAVSPAKKIPLGFLQSQRRTAQDFDGAIL